MSDTRKIRLGTRRSKLALWQANYIRDRLLEHFGPAKGGDLEVELVEIVTEGDRILDRPLAQIGGKGLFVTGIEERLQSGDIDFAVHSMKDLPAHLPDGLEIACTPERADARDALVGPADTRLVKLPPGTRVGTSSLRRAALARRLNPALQIVSIRGNVPTRVSKIESGECDAVILAAAGLERLGMGDHITEHLDPERFCPAACQGILGIEIRSDDRAMRELLAPLRHPKTEVEASTERAFLSHLDGGCQVPMACHAQVQAEDVITAHGLIVDPSGRPCFMATKAGHPRDAVAIGQELAESLLRLGAKRVIDSLVLAAKVA